MSAGLGSLAQLAVAPGALLRQRCVPGQVSPCQECKEGPRVAGERYEEDGGKVGKWLSGSNLGFLPADRGTD